MLQQLLGRLWLLCELFVNGRSLSVDVQLLIRNDCD